MHSLQIGLPTDVLPSGVRVSAFDNNKRGTNSRQHRGNLHSSVQSSPSSFQTPSPDHINVFSTASSSTSTSVSTGEQRQPIDMPPEQEVAREHAGRVKRKAIDAFKNCNGDDEERKKISGVIKMMNNPTANDLTLMVAFETDGNFNSQQYYNYALDVAEA